EAIGAVPNRAIAEHPEPVGVVAERDVHHVLERRGAGKPVDVDLVLHHRSVERHTGCAASAGNTDATTRDLPPVDLERPHVPFARVDAHRSRPDAADHLRVLQVHTDAVRADGEHLLEGVVGGHELRVWEALDPADLETGDDGCGDAVAMN